MNQLDAHALQHELVHCKRRLKAAKAALESNDIIINDQRNQIATLKESLSNMAKTKVDNGAMLAQLITSHNEEKQNLMQQNQKLQEKLRELLNDK